MISRRSRLLGVLFLVVAGASAALPAAADRLFSGGSAPFPVLVPGPVLPPAGVACNGISNTTGNPDQLVPAGAAGIFVQRFVPPALPFRPTSICFAGAAFDGLQNSRVRAGSAVAGPASYDLVLFSDANGTPGVRLATIPSPPEPVGAYPGTWITTSLAGAGPVLYGPFWVGFDIHDANFGLDFTSTATPVPEAASLDGGATWSPSELAANASIQVVGLAGADAVSIPTLSGAGLGALVLALAAGGLLLLRKV